MRELGQRFRSFINDQLPRTRNSVAIIMPLWFVAADIIAS
jgi:hypothetical protein